ncbi:MAG: MFS transporter [Fimbriimonadaceae bacterium]
MNPASVLHIRPFRDLWLGQAISQLGDSLYYLIFLFMVDKITKDSQMVGFVGAIQTLPFLLFGLYAGVVADRIDRRTIMLASDLLSVLLLLAFAVLVFFQPEPPLIAIFSSAFFLALMTVFFMPAKNAAIPRLVPPDFLMRANALSMATQNMMPLIGIALSGGILGQLYAQAPDTFFFSAVIFNAASFAWSYLFIRRLPRLIPDRTEATRHPWVELKEGLRYVRRTRVLWVLLLLSLGMNLVISPFMVVYVAVNREWFGGNFTTFAIIEGAFLIGLVLSSLYVGRVRVVHPGRALSISLLFVGLTVVLLGYSREVWLFCLFNFLAGVALPYAQIPISTYVQLTVPDEYRGRVNSAMTLVSLGVQPVGMGLAGVLIHRFGLVAMFLAMGFGMAAVAALGLADRPFRNAEMPHGALSSGAQ